MIIYLIKNKNTKKIYVGKTIKTAEVRLQKHFKNAHKGRKSRLYSSIRKHGELAFEIFVVYELTQSECSEEKLNILERAFIALLRSNNPCVGYNMTEGGDGGRNEASIKSSKAFRTGKTYEELYPNKFFDIKDKISKGIKNFYKTHKMIISDDVKKRLSKIQKDKFANDPEYRVSLLERIKKIPRRKVGEFCHTQETKDKIGKCRKGKKYDEIFDIHKSQELKNKQAQRWSGKDNPNYVDLPFDVQVKVLYTAICKDRTVSSVGKQFSISEYVVRKIFRKLGIKNIQKFKQEVNCRSVLEEKLYGFTHSQIS